MFLLGSSPAIEMQGEVDSSSVKGCSIVRMMNSSFLELASLHGVILGGEVIYEESSEFLKGREAKPLIKKTLLLF